MAASSSDLLTQATTNSRPSPTQVASTRSSGGTTLACLALTGWPTVSGVHFITYKVNTSGAKIAGSQCDWEGVVSGTNITNIVLKAGTDVGNAVGDIVEAAPTAAYANGLYSWGSAHADPTTGALLTSAVQTALSLGTGALNGWNVLAFNPATVTANGNRSYSLVFNGQDLTSTLSPGMRLRTTRTVAAPTQSTSLNGTNQYFTKAAPAGMTFSTAFTTMGWIKLSAYPTGAQGGSIIGRTDTATGGYQFRINTSGQVSVYYAGSSLFTEWVSYQSVPLNKWVHVAAAVSSVSGKTLQGIYIDGVSVPTTAGGVQSATTLVQTSNLSVGAAGAGVANSFFPGSIAQAAVFSTNITQPTIQSYISQGLAGPETGLVSAYSLNNTVNDLNTTNANNLTANGSAVATNADSPFGGQADSTISSTLDYGIVQKATFSTNTTVTVQAAEGCTIPTSGGVAAVAYSSNKNPYGFPSNREKWRIKYISKALQTLGSNPTQNTWYNPQGTLGSPQLSVPIGDFELSAAVTPYYYKAGATLAEAKVTLSTSQSAESDSEFTMYANYEGPSGTVDARSTMYRSKGVSNSAITPYYLNFLTPTAGNITDIGINGASSTTILTAEVSGL